jgi:hypothetical protein
VEGAVKPQLTTVPTADVMKIGDLFSGIKPGIRFPESATRRWHTIR